MLGGGAPRTSKEIDLNSRHSVELVVERYYIGKKKSLEAVGDSERMPTTKNDDNTRMRHG